MFNISTETITLNWTYIN